MFSGLDSDTKHNIKLEMDSAMQKNQSDIKPTDIRNIMEPLVQIKTEPSDTHVDETQTKKSDAHAIHDITEPDIQIIEDSVPETQETRPSQKISGDSSMYVKPEPKNFFENIGLFENTNAGNAVAKIGECTISVATGVGNNVLSTENPL